MLSGSAPWMDPHSQRSGRLVCCPSTTNLFDITVSFFSFEVFDSTSVFFSCKDIRLFLYSLSICSHGSISTSPLGAAAAATSSGAWDTKASSAIPARGLITQNACWQPPPIALDDSGRSVQLLSFLCFQVGPIFPRCFVHLLYLICF